MRRKGVSLDKVDKSILRTLQIDSRISLEKMAKELDIPKSTVHYRTRKMEEEGIIEGYHAKVNAVKLGKDYVTVTCVRAKYGPCYHDKIGEMLAQIAGVFGVYFVFGEYDFIVLTRSSNRGDFLRKLERMTNIEQIERTNTQVVGKILKEDYGTEIE